jgi:hypothetical protein
MDFVATDLIARSALSRPTAGRAALAGTRNSTRRWAKAKCKMEKARHLQKTYRTSCAENKSNRMNKYLIQLLLIASFSAYASDDQAGFGAFLLGNTSSDMDSPKLEAGAIIKYNYGLFNKNHFSILSGVGVGTSSNSTICSQVDISIDYHSITNKLLALSLRPTLLTNWNDNYVNRHIQNKSWSSNNIYSRFYLLFGGKIGYKFIGLEGYYGTTLVSASLIIQLYGSP